MVGQQADQKNLGCEDNVKHEEIKELQKIIIVFGKTIL